MTPAKKSESVTCLLNIEPKKDGSVLASCEPHGWSETVPADFDEQANVRLDEASALTSVHWEEVVSH